MSRFQQSASDFMQQVADYQGEYSSDREFALQKVLRESQKRESEGAEILNVAAPSAFKIFSKGLERANVAGKITKKLDDYEASLPPSARTAFRLVRNVASDVIGAAPGRLGEVVRNAEGVIRGQAAPAPAPTTQEQQEPESLPEPEPATAGGSVLAQEQELPTIIPESDNPKDYIATVQSKLRQLGHDDQADALDQNLSKANVRNAYRTLQAQEGDPEAQQLVQRWGSAIAKYRANVENPAAPAARVQDEFDPSLLPEGAGGRIAPTESTSEPPQAAEQVRESTQPDVAPGYRVIADTMQSLTEGRPNPSSTVSDIADTATDAATSALGLASTALSGRAREIVGDTTLAISSVRELAAGELPTGALLTGINAGLARLGQAGREAGSALSTTVQGVNVARQVGGIASRLLGQGAATESTDAAITAQSTAENISGQAARLLGRTVGRQVGEVAAEEGGEVGAVEAGTDAGGAIVQSLTDAAVGSTVADETPIGWAVTAGLGLAAGLASLGEGIKDIFAHHHTHMMRPPGLPSFQSGVTG